MTIEIRAPFTGPTAIMLLPNPILNNEEAVEQSVNHRLAMDGTNYTYVKTGPDRKLTLSFENQGRGKMVEVQEFYRLFAGQRMRFIDWRGDEWNVVFDAAPIDFSTGSRGAPGGGSRQEQGSFELVLVGAKL